MINRRESALGTGEESSIRGNIGFLMRDTALIYALSDTLSAESMVINAAQPAAVPSPGASERLTR